MAMNMNKLTEKAQEAIVAAQRLAEERHHTQLEPEHLLYALVDSGGRRRAGHPRASRDPGQERPRGSRARPGWLRAWLGSDAGPGLQSLSARLRGGGP